MKLLTTLGELSKHPLRVASSIDIMASDLASRLLPEKKNAPVSPDVDAVNFYALNQAVAAMTSKFTPNEVLPSWAAKLTTLYSEELYAQHQRMFWYTFLVVSREFRHVKYWDTLEAKHPSVFTPKIKALASLIKDSTDEAVLNIWLAKVPNITLSEYLGIITLAFNTKGHWSSSFGGEKWGLISQTLLNYVDGKISAEIFIDTAYTLAHNNGPMFNKGMFYAHYSPHFLTLLDVQRGGQMMQALYGKFAPSSGSSLITSPEFILAKSELGLNGYIDWFAVEASGSLKKYPVEKAQQLKKHPLAPVITLVDGKPIKVIGEFEWFPGQAVDIYERVT